jgi:8-oxo-dGTP diphosphatase
MAGRTRRPLWSRRGLHTLAFSKPARRTRSANDRLVAWSTVRRLAYRLIGHLPFAVKVALNRRVNTTFLVGLIGIVFDDNRRVLILKHTYRPGMPFGLPSGWLRKGESLAEALRREVAEETGFEVSFERLLEAEAGDRPARIDVWIQLRLMGGKFVPSAEVSEGRFYRFDELPPLLEPQRRFLESLMASDAGSPPGDRCRTG